MLLAHWLLPLKNRPVSSRRSRRRRMPTVPAVEQFEPRILLHAGHGISHEPLPAPAPALFAASDMDVQGGRVDGDVEIAAPFRRGRSDTDGDRPPLHESDDPQFSTLSGGGSGSGSGGGSSSGGGGGDPEIIEDITAINDPDAAYFPDSLWYETLKDSPPKSFYTVTWNDEQDGTAFVSGRPVELIDDVDNGTLQLDLSSGYFTYQPNPGFVGTDTFQYRVYINESYIIHVSNVATATIEVVDVEPLTFRDDNRDQDTNGCSCSCGCDDATSPAPNTGATAGPNVNPATGGLTWDVSSLFGLAGGLLPSYASLENPHPIFPIDIGFFHYLPGTIHTEMTWGGIADDPHNFFVHPDLQNEIGRLALQVDASALPTGRYPYEVEVTAQWRAVSETTVLQGYDYVFNRSDSEFGNRWWLPGLDQLQIETGGVSILRADGSAGFFEQQPDDSFFTPYGSLTELEENLDGTYTLHGHDGEHTLFDSSGRLTQIEDANGNITAYTYASGRLSQITDPYGRTAAYTYGTDDKLDTVEDFQGRIFLYQHDGDGLLTSITGPDPDGAGPLTAPQILLAYDPTTKLLNSVTDPEGNVTQIVYGPDLRVTSIDQDGMEFRAFGTSDSLALDTLILREDARAVISVGTVSTLIDTDRFGWPTLEADALGNTFEWRRNEHGQVLGEIRPLENGQVLETGFEYDGHGRMTFRTDTGEAWTYDTGSHSHKPLTHTRGGETWTFTYDGNHNLQTSADPLGNVTAYTYTTRGLVETITGADPDGTGPLTSPVTSFQYDTMGRLTQIAYADQTTETFTWDSADNLTSETDRLGRTTSYTWDPYGRLLTKSLPDPDGTGPLAAPVSSFSWDKMGRLTSEIDPLGNAIAYTYTSLGLLASVTLPDPDGAGVLTSSVYTYGYDKGRLQTVTDPLGNVTTYGYDPVGNLTSLALPDPDGAGPLTAPVYAWGYDPARRRTSETDPLGNVTTFTHDALDRVTSVTRPDPDGAGPLTAPVTTYEYLAGRLQKITDALGRITEFGRDAAGNLTSVTLPDPDGAGPLAAPVYAWGYDALNRVINEADALGNVTSYKYDDLDRLVEQTGADPDGAGPLTAPVTSWVYDDAGELTSVTDALNRTTAFSYDGLGQLLTTTLPDPDGAGPLAAPVYAREYDLAGNLIAESDPLGNVTSYQYDNLYRLVSRTEADPDGAGPLESPVTTWEYGALSELTAMTDALGRTTAFSYDNLGRQTKTTLPDPDGAGPLTAPEYATTYDALGNVLTTVDPLGNTTSFEYDALNRRVKRTEADPDGAGPLGNPVTAWVYDLVGNLTSLADAENNTTSWVYDDLDRVISETNELNATRSYVYDLASNLTKVTDRNGRIIEYAYDNLLRPTQEVWKDASSNTVNTITSTYDAGSQLTSISDGLSTYAYTYDLLGRVTDVDNNGTPNQPNVVLTSAYDANGNRTQLAATVNGTADFVNAYSYDNLSRMTRIEQTDGAPSAGDPISGKRVDLAYNAASQFETITRYADLAGTDLVATSSHSYDGIGRLTGLSHSKGANTLADYAWTFDVASRITSRAARTARARTATTPRRN